MIRNSVLRFSLRSTGALAILLVAVVVAPAAAAVSTVVPSAALETATKAWIKSTLTGPNQRATASRQYRPGSDGSYLVTAQVDTATAADLTTERYQLTLRPDPAKPERFVVADAALQDKKVALHRDAGFNCAPFEKFKFEREGMTMSASSGWFCERYYAGTEVNAYYLTSNDIKYDFTPPAHLAEEDSAMVYSLLKRIRASELIVNPAAFFFYCDAETCEQLIRESFTGLTRVAPAERSADSHGLPSNVDPRLLEVMDTAFDVYQLPPQIVSRKSMREGNPFAEFRAPIEPGRKQWSAGVIKDKNHWMQLDYDNWGGYELQFNVYQTQVDFAQPKQPLNGLVFGYYTKQTLDTTTAVDRERRTDPDARWHDVYKVAGDVNLALDDPELLTATITFGLHAKEDLEALDFQIQSIPRQAGADTRQLSVNSFEFEGQELTWVKTRPIAGRVYFPHKIPAGTKFEVKVDFASRALRQINYAFTAMNRFGWMPFVRFADFIDEFEMTIRSPAKYQVLGVGRKVSEKVQNDVLVSHWKAHSPVVFPTIIFGRYKTDTPGEYQATKIDGTKIPVTVHVDEASFTEWGIRPDQLRPFATQAAVSIDLYKEVSGVDYPYGELNLVNDFQGGMYGQAPSSLIYLGSPVFRSAAARGGGAGTSTSKFLKSVVAHEVGHQWWGSRVSNANERNYWFVESLAEYFSALYLEQAYGRKEYQEQVEEWRRNILDNDLKTSVQNASSHWGGDNPGRAYQAAVYSKGPYLFHTLRQTFGDEKFFKYLREFTQDLAERREIVSRDIQSASERFLGGVGADGNPYNVDLEWFFDQWLRGAAIPQYRLEYDVRQAESGEWIVEGVIQQRVVVGNKSQFEVIEGKNYRGIVDITAVVKGGKELRKRVIVEKGETPFSFPVSEKPLEVSLNKYAGILAHDVRVNRAW